MIVNNALGAGVLVTCQPETCTASMTTEVNYVSNCLRTKTTCYNGVRVNSCTTCAPDLTPTTMTTSIDDCANAIEFVDCVETSTGGSGTDCTSGCENCTSTEWTDYMVTGYQKRTKKTCNTTSCTCTSATEYRCASGYYKSATIACSLNVTTKEYTCGGCTKCDPFDTGNTMAIGRSPAGSTSKTQCYLWSGTPWTDDTGTGVFDDECYWTNTGTILPINPA